MPRTVTRKRQPHVTNRRVAFIAVPDPEPGAVIAATGPGRELTSDEAEAITSQLTTVLGNWDTLGATIAEIALEAFQRRVWVPLGYKDWAAYVDTRFPHREFPRAMQAALNAALINQGELSARAAAAISGTDHKTAAKDAAKATGETSPVGKTRTGADGKKRAASKPARPRSGPADGRNGSNVVPIRPQPDTTLESERNSCPHSPFGDVIALFRDADGLLETAGSTGLRPTAHELRELEKYVRSIIERMADLEASAV